ncbi:disulfide bond formation protein B [Lyticum sinuosum]|uniref:Disulfide bond formation protein B n=1 Tax=Lyticum sinuosum TaxID=1332059 RepID=A0AAE4VKU2_9RICK|nr:disulfide bond formation protein B [Lyticum sinuosum]MDZ5761435.1 Disulfide bond formation protein B [Lyticum sinuosum]
MTNKIFITLKSLFNQAYSLFFAMIWLCCAVLFSYIAEYLLKLYPCKLCLYQRYIYVTGLIINTFFVIYFSDKFRYFMHYINNYDNNDDNDKNLKKNKNIDSNFVKNVYFIIIFLIALIELLLSFFHFGVEQKWWKFISTCTNNLNKANSIQEFQLLLESAEYAMCDIPSKIIGIPMTILNIIYSLVFLIIWIIIFRKNKYI